MAQVKPIRTEADRQAALARIDALIDLDGRAPAETEELTVLADLVESYENKHFPIPAPTPIEAIRFRMEQLGLESRDLAPHIGSRGKVSEVLSGKRPLTLPMIRALSKNLGIPADVLLQEQGSQSDPESGDNGDCPLDLSCPRFSWTAICPTGGSHDEVQHEQDRTQ